MSSFHYIYVHVDNVMRAMSKALVIMVFDINSFSTSAIAFNLVSEPW